MSRPRAFSTSLLASSGRSTLGLAVLTAAFASCTPPEKKEPAPVTENAPMKRVRQVFARIPQALARNHKSLETSLGPVAGFGAGDSYPQIWLRDSAWIVPAAASYYDAPTLSSWLDLHLSVAEKSGRLRDWVASGAPEVYREWAPRVKGVGAFSVDTNTTESDQEPSAALAHCRAEEAMGGSTTAPAEIRNKRLARVVIALEALLRERTDPASGLIWSGLTADWGDVSPMYPDQRAIYLDARTPRTLSLYGNVMMVAALDCTAAIETRRVVRDRLAARARALKDKIRKRFWMKDRGFFRIRLPLDPLPPGFEDDDDRFALGGNALAALFGVADDEQATAIFETAERLRLARGFSTISTTLIPPYAAGVFQHPAMRDPDKYQNGGQWDWYGAALIEAEFERGDAGQARRHLEHMVSRILRAGPGIHEWYGHDDTPNGSPAYAAAAAALHSAIVRGLFGVAPSREGLSIAIRVGETFLPFEIPEKAVDASIELSQTVHPGFMDVVVQSRLKVREVCSLLPPGRSATGAPSNPLAQSIRTVGHDTLICANTSDMASPIRLRLAYGH